MSVDPAPGRAGTAGAASRHLGLDLGGTNIKWAVVERVPGAGDRPAVDPDAWRTLATGQGPTDAERGPDAVVDRLGAMGAAVLADWPGIASVGVGVPGLYDPEAGAVRFLVNLPGPWAGKAVAGPVGSALGLPAFLINDARAFGLAELRLGAARGASSMIGFTLGTGIGGVIAVGGRVHQGHDGTAGELGHQTIDPDGPICGCGNRGCLEAHARGDRIAEACGTATPEEAFRRAREGDARAIAGIERIGTYLGLGIANMITVLTPDRVVLGGGISASLDLLLPSIEAELRRRVLTTALDGVTIAAAELGTWAGAIGAAIHGSERAREAGGRTAAGGMAGVAGQGPAGVAR